MSDNKEADMKKEEREQILELGSDITKSGKGNIYTLTIIGQVEGHQVAPETVKTTKYEHVLPLLASMEESNETDGILLVVRQHDGNRVALSAAVRQFEFVGAHLLGVVYNCAGENSGSYRGKQRS